jgi:hypothetical protein
VSWEGKARKIYEERVVNDALARLAGRIDLKALPLSDEELRTLARRARQAFKSRERHAERLARYVAHLARIHGAEVLAGVTAALEQINNEIGYEEK